MSQTLWAQLTEQGHGSRPRCAVHSTRTAHLEMNLGNLVMMGPDIATDPVRIDRALRPLRKALDRLSPAARIQVIDRVIVPTLQRSAHLAPILDRFRALAVACVPPESSGAPAVRLEALRRHIGELDALRNSGQPQEIRIRVRGQLLEACRRLVRQMPRGERDQAADLIARAVEARRQQIAELGA